MSSSRSKLCGIRKCRACKGKWHAQLRDCETGTPINLEAKVVVNAAGPFLDGLNKNMEYAYTTSDRLFERRSSRRIS